MSEYAEIQAIHEKFFQALKATEEQDRMTWDDYVEFWKDGYPKRLTKKLKSNPLYLDFADFVQKKGPISFRDYFNQRIYQGTELIDPGVIAYCATVNSGEI